MKMSLTRQELQAYTSAQLNNLFPDPYRININEYESSVSTALDRLEHCYNHVTLKHYFDGKSAVFNHLHSDQYVMYIWFLANTIWKENHNESLCNKLYYLNKSLHGLDCMYNTELPDIFLIFHGVGTMLGKAAYNDFFVVLQGCTVGSHKGQYPKIGKGVSLAAHSALLGDCTIGDRVSIGAGTVLFKVNIPPDSSVSEDKETGVCKIRPASLNYAQQFFNVDLTTIK